MDAQLVYHRFLLLAGLPEQQNAALFSLCEEAARELERRLRPGAEHTSPRLIYPAAAMALSLIHISAADWSIQRRRFPSCRNALQWQ